MSLLGFLGLVQSESLAVGARVPEISATDQDGSTVNLAEACREGLTLVYFYPKADTPGCTAQACSLRDAFADIANKGVRVFGVSTDKPEAQKKFRGKYKLPFTLLADPEGKVTRGFGVPTMPVVGLAARQTFLIRDGTVIWRDLKPSPIKQAADLLAAVSKP